MLQLVPTLLLKTLHCYIGLLVCGFLFCISLSGTLLLLKREYLWISYDDARTAIDYTKLPNTVRSIENSYTQKDLFVQLHTANLGLHKVFLPDRRYAYHNQSGQLLNSWTGNNTIEDWLLDFHHRFLLGNTIGLNMAGFSGLLSIFLALIGVFLWWPYRRFWKPKLRFSAKHSHARSSHTNLGAPLLLPLLLLTVTGVILVYPTESRWLLQNNFSSVAPKTILQEEPISIADVDAQIEFALDTFPGAKLRWLQSQVLDAEAPLIERTIGLSQQGAWDTSGKTSIQFKAQGLVIKDARRQSNSVRAVGLSYVLHIGGIHLLYRLTLIFVGLAMCALSFFALRSFYLRRFR